MKAVGKRTGELQSLGSRGNYSSKLVRKHLKDLQKVKRKEHHRLIHKIHKRHRISKRTLFYVKEYGKKSNVMKTIVRESIGILLLASILSSFGGFALEQIKMIFVSIVPLIILLPALNDMIGDYGTIVSSRLSTMLYEGRVKRNWWASKELRRLFAQIFIIAVLAAGFSAAAALAISGISGYAVSAATAIKVLFITMADTILLVGILFFASVFAGLYFYSKKEDPNNFLIPITTAIADFGNMVILSILIILVF